MSINELFFVVKLHKKRSAYSLKKNCIIHVASYFVHTNMFSAPKKLECVTVHMQADMYMCEECVWCISLLIGGACVQQSGTSE